MPVVNLFDAQRDRIHVIAGGGWIAIAADQPNQVIEAGIAFAGILPPGAALRGTVGERLFDPAFIGADVAQVDRREEDLNALLAGFTDDPVGVFEVRLVGRREIAGNQERRLPVAIDRTMEFMLDEITMMELKPLRRRSSRYNSTSSLVRPEIRDQGAFPWIRNG